MNSWTPLLTRLSVGFVFAYGAWDKFQNLDQVIAQYTQAGLPLVEPLTYLVSGLELVGGILIMLGLFTRVAVIPLMVIEAIAIFTVKWSLSHNLAQTLNFTEVLYILLFTWLLTYGPGKFSLDNLRLKK